MRLKDAVALVNERTDRVDKRYVALENIVSWDGTFVETAATTEGTNSVFQSGDVLFGKLRPYLAKGFLPDFDGICSTEFFVMRPRKQILNKFLLYYFLSPHFIDEIKHKVAGVKMPRTDWGTFGAMNIVPPPLPEQRRIVAYLDEKTATIDRRISLLEKKQEAFKRLKKSVIHRAVTRGLDPDAKLKDSGVDWIGHIPDHWSVERMKSVFSERDLLSTTGQEDLLSVSEYYGVAKRKDKMQEGEAFESRSDSLVGYKICKPGDLAINIMLAWKRALGVSEFSGIVSPAYAVYRLLDGHPRYYHYLLRTDTYAAEFRRKSRGIIESRLRMYTERFYQIQALKPPVEEQRAIAAYLDTECAKIDAAVANLDKQIDAYRRLKRSLIDEVITGKRKVG